jgi:hypothetical protein
MALLTRSITHVRELACRPCDGTTRTQRNLINPAFLFVGREHAMFAIRSGFDESAIIATGEDSPLVGRARKNCTGVDLDPTFAFICEQQRFLAENEHRRGAEKMHPNHRRTRAEWPRAFG